jgi:hypothetical protein
MYPRACTAACITAMLTFTHTTSADTPAKDPAAVGAGCFSVGGGYLRARVRGALNLDLDWKNAEMQCEGGPRPPGKDNERNGVRVSIGGPAGGDGHRIRLVFGIAGVGEGRGGETLRTNVTILFEGEKRIFATQGDDKCTVDALTQERVEPLGGGLAVYRVVARGFCLGPATSLSREERVFLTSFDFAGRVEFSDDDRHAPPASTPSN